MLKPWLHDDLLAKFHRYCQTLVCFPQSKPNHAAATLFPKELLTLLNFQQTTISQIGLLLPLSGDGQILGT
ncbi:penicillin-binding protein activator, partial [Haemophilus influenzae]|uniref:penicillin-binding protein activator n=1 Tax=Haemophilus influenzae TaxID=727 RepID=UPI0030F3ECBE